MKLGYANHSYCTPLKDHRQAAMPNPVGLISENKSSPEKQFSGGSVVGGPTVAHIA
jgi:hypothetical protein